jgi:hypothetical protein
MSGTGLPCHAILSCTYYLEIVSCFSVTRPFVQGGPRQSLYTKERIVRLGRPATHHLIRGYRISGSLDSEDPLEGDFRVRAAVRSQSKADHLKARFVEYQDKLELILTLPLVSLAMRSIILTRLYTLRLPSLALTRTRQTHESTCS